MFFPRLSILMVTASCSVFAALPQFKLFRDYVAIKAVHPYQKHFRVYFTDIEPAVCSVAIADGEDPATLDRKNFSCGSGIFGVHNQLPPLPPAQQALAQQLIARTQALHPKGHDFSAMFEGDFRAIDIVEFSPFALQADPSHDAVNSIALSLRIDRASGALSLGGSGIGVYGRGISQFCAAFAYYGNQGCADKPLYLVDYTLPPEIEGSSIIAGQFGNAAKESPIYQREWETLSAKIKATADALEAGTYQDPRAEILARQGDSKLPPQYRPFYDLKASGYVDVGTGPRDTKRVEGRLRFPQADALNADYPLSIAFAGSDLTLEGTLNLGTKKARFVLHDSKGNASAPADFTIEYKDTEVVRDGDRVALPSFFSLKGPGADQFTENQICIGQPYKTPCVSVDESLNLSAVFPTASTAK